MKQYNDVKLSGKHTDLSFWIGLIILPPIFVLLIFILLNGNHSDVKLAIFLFIFGAIIMIFLWMMFLLTKAEIKNNQLHFKKYFRETKIFKLSDITNVKTYNSTNIKHIQLSEDGLKARKDTYNLVFVENQGVKEKFLIVGCNFFLGDEPVDSEQILKEILIANKKS